MKHLKKIFIVLLMLCFVIQPVQFAFPNESPPDGPDDNDCCKKREKKYGIDLKCDEDPVSPMGGKFYFSLNDLVFGPDRSYMEVSQLYVKRFFSSQSAYNGVFGIGWSSNIDMGVSTMDTGVSLRNEFGALIHFPADDLGNLISPICATSIINKVADGYIWKLRFGSEIFFEKISKNGFEGHRLSTMKDRFGNSIRYEYDDNICTTEQVGDKQKITYYPVKILQENTGLFIDISYTKRIDTYGTESFYVDSINDSTGRKVKYGYKILEGTSDKYYLSSVTDPAGNTMYYDFLLQDNGDGGKDIIAFKTTDKRDNDTTYYFNQPFEIPTHDGNWSWNLRVVKVVDALGNQEIYDFDTNLSMSVHTDKNGNQTVYKYSYMHIDEVLYANGKSEKYFYDERRNRNRIIDSNDNETQYLFDDKGNILKETDALGNIASWTYDIDNNLWTSFTDKNRNAWLRQVDDRSVEGETNPLGNTVQYEHDAYGNIITKIDCNGNRITYIYDSPGNLISMIDAEGNARHYTYNQQGDMLTQTDPEGNTTSYAYDLLRRVTSVIYTDGSKVEYGYDPNDNVISEKDPNGNITTYEYNALNKKTAVRFSDGTAISYEYDAQGNLAKEIRPGGAWQYTCDEMNRKIKALGPDGSETLYSYEGSAGCNTCSSIDQLGSITDPLGHKTTFDYDPLGRKVFDKDDSSRAVEYAYDPNNNLTKIIDQLGHEAQYVYDSSNRLIAVTNAIGEKVEIGYDKNGNKTSLKDAKGNTTRYEYNRNNMVTKTIDANGGETLFTYDVNNNRTSVTDSQGNITRREYDNRDRLTKVTDANGAYESFSYDTNSNLIKNTNPDGSIIEYQYDVMNRLVKKVLPGNSVVDYTYDISGNLSSIRDSIGLRTFQYDNLTRLTNVTYPGDYTVKYEYDLAGNRIKLIYPSGTTVQYSYNNLNLLTGINVTRGVETESFTYSHDEKGRRTVLSYPNGLKTLYSYDDADRLLGITIGTGTSPASTESINYSYDLNGNRVTRQDSFGLSKYAYDNTNQLIKAEYPEGALKEYDFDRIGNRLQLAETNEAGSEIITSEFNGLNQLTKTESSLYKGGNLVSLFGGVQDAALSKVALNGKEATLKNDFFSIADFQLSVGDNDIVIEALDKAGNKAEKHLKLKLDDKAKTTYSYDLNGNLKTKSEKGLAWNFSWDAENRLTEAVSSEGKVIEYAWYDGIFNNMAYRKEGLVIEKYIYDGSHCIAKYDSNGNLIQEFFYGPDTDEILCRKDSDGKNYYFHQDGVNSVAAVSDNAGAKAASYSYDVYGKIRNQTGSLTNEIAFTGRWFDETTGLHYYRARWYDAEQGRFLSKDPIEYLGGDINLYRYVQNIPTNFNDPFGLYNSGKGEGHTVATNPIFREGVENYDNRWTSPYVQPWLHFRSKAAVSKDLQNAVDNCDKKAFENHEHEWQDTYTHYDEGFRWWTGGHGLDTLWHKLTGKGKDTDTYDPKNSERDREMTRTSKDWENKFFKNCCKEKDGTWTKI